MSKQKVQMQLESVILETSKRLKKRKNGPSPDLLTSLAKMTNALRRLYETGGSSRQGKIELTEEYKKQHGDPTYYEKLLKKGKT